ncbi:MAG: hypothetical protein KAR01_07510 [Desulfocapsa sp.]|nr:hypothetical protein [Desulfocapsa sp.]
MAIWILVILPLAMFFDHLTQQNIICAHRGARSIAPENTFLAMKTARECGSHCWETDVRLSKDGELIIFHDNTLSRTTDIATNSFFTDRTTLPIDQFTFEELLHLDAGSWFLETDPFKTVQNSKLSNNDISVIKEQKIPLLREVLNYSKKHSFPVNIEIKDIGTPSGDVLIVEQILEMLNKTQTVDLALISSFRHEYLQRARELNEDLSLAALVKGKHPENLVKYLTDLSVTAYHPEEILCNADLVNQLKKAGIRVNTWTVNDMEMAKEILDYGAGVITDWPQLLIH